MAHRDESNIRRYKALEIGCPSCNARAGQLCRRDDGSPMRGVHRRRDLEWNRLAWLKETGAPTLEAVR